MRFFKKFIFAPAILLPLLALAEETANTNTRLDNPLGTNATGGDLPVGIIFGRAANGLAFVTGTLTLLMVIIGGYMILTAAGNSERFAKGKKSITYAIIGLFVVVGSYQILATTMKVLSGGSLSEFSSKPTLFDPLGLTDLPTGTAPFVLYGKRIIGTMVNFLGIAVVAMYTFGGLQWMLSGGSEEKISKAKKTLLYATLGALVVLSSYILIKFIYNPVASTLFTG